LSVDTSPTFFFLSMHRNCATLLLMLATSVLVHGFVPDQHMFPVSVNVSHTVASHNITMTAVKTGFQVSLTYDAIVFTQEIPEAGSKFYVGPFPPELWPKHTSFTNFEYSIQNTGFNQARVGQHPFHVYAYDEIYTLFAIFEDGYFIIPSPYGNGDWQQYESNDIIQFGFLGGTLPAYPTNTTDVPAFAL
jgi:hypothetical protein